MKRTMGEQPVPAERHGNGFEPNLNLGLLFVKNPPDDLNGFAIEGGILHPA